MPTDVAVIVAPDRAALARDVANRFVSTVEGLLAERSVVHIVLTGGTVGGAVLAAIAAHESAAALDWARVHVWWGDERWVAAGDPERNDGQARVALLDRVPIPRENIHAFPAADEEIDLAAAATRYRDALLRAGGGEFPRFAITFLGVGPDGHVASLFPGHTGPTIAEPDVIAVRNSPKPPPERLSLTLPLINASERVWLVLAGADKAVAISRALSGADITEIPAAGVRGQRETIVFVDQDAAAEIG